MTWKVMIFILLSYNSDVLIVGSAKILAIYPFDSHSHFKAYEPLLEELIGKGHNLTLLSRISLNDVFSKDYIHLDIKDCTESYKNSDIDIMNWNPLQEIVYLSELNIGYCENIIKCPKVQEFINSEDSFDLIISELFLGTDIFFALGKKFNAPVISTTSQCLFSHYNWILGNPDSSVFSDSFMKTIDMSFVSRALNFGFQLCSILFHEFYSFPRYQNMVEKYFNFEKENLPSIKEIMKNVSVSLVNSHYSLGFNKPNLPNVVYVAGIHLTSPQPLPDNLKKFMDEAEYGIIYVSFGSTVETDSMHTLGLTILNVLEVLPQRIVIKWDQKLSSHGSENILIGEWFPQSNILSHPNCHLFITHGGYLSLLESLNASVPVIGIPLFGDQHYNMAMVEQFRLGMKVELDNIPSELPGKIDEVLKNPKFKNNMQKRSLLFRNRLTSPLDTAMYWVDHVLTHKDTSHLKPASVRLTWFEFYSLDVLGVLLILSGTVFFALKFMIRKLAFLVLVLSIRTQTWWIIKSRQGLTKRNLKND